MAVQNASFIPVRYATPGIPIKSHPDISDASALRAVIHGPVFRPPRKKSEEFLFVLEYIIPITIMHRKYNANAKIVERLVIC